MKKIPTIYRRDPNNMARVTDERNPDCGWVFAGEGTPTRKYDGTCVMYDGDQWWARREVKPGKTPPPGWRLVETDPSTGKSMGWEPITEQWQFWKPFREALAPLEEFGWFSRLPMPAGTFELIGPKINGNPERLERHRIKRHIVAELVALLDEDGNDVPNPDPRSLIELCREWGWEGIVWHHPDGRMAKLKVRDYPEARP